MKIGQPPSVTASRPWAWAGCSLAILLGACSSSGGLAARNGGFGSGFGGGAADRIDAVGMSPADRLTLQPTSAAPAARLNRTDLSAFPAPLALGPIFDFGRMAVREAPAARVDANAVYSLPGASLALNTEAAAPPRAMKVNAIAHHALPGTAAGPAEAPAPVHPQE